MRERRPPEGRCGRENKDSRESDSHLENLLASNSKDYNDCRGDPPHIARTVAVNARKILGAPACVFEAKAIDIVLYCCNHVVDAEYWSCAFKLSEKSFPATS
jgi:hypothetical protein